MSQPPNYSYNLAYSSVYPPYSYSMQTNPAFHPSRFNMSPAYVDPRTTWGYNQYSYLGNYNGMGYRFGYYNQPPPQSSDDQALNLRKREKIIENDEKTTDSQQTGGEFRKHVVENETDVEKFVQQPIGDGRCKTKRTRTSFTTEQMQKLEDTFENVQYLVGEERKTLAESMDLLDVQVKVWFQNRRIKWRKQMLEKKQNAENEKKTEEITVDDGHLKRE